MGQTPRRDLGKVGGVRAGVAPHHKDEIQGLIEEALDSLLTVLGSTADRLLGTETGTKNLCAEAAGLHIAEEARDLEGFPGEHGRLAGHPETLQVAGGIEAFRCRFRQRGKELRRASASEEEVAENFRLTPVLDDEVRAPAFGPLSLPAETAWRLLPRAPCDRGRPR